MARTHAPPSIVGAWRRRRVAPVRLGFPLHKVIPWQRAVHGIRARRSWSVSNPPYDEAQQLGQHVGRIGPAARATRILSADALAMISQSLVEIAGCGRGRVSRRNSMC